MIPQFPLVPSVLGVPAVFRTAGASFLGSITSTTLSVSQITSGILTAGQSITGTGVLSGTRILSAITGAGGIGTYAVNLAQTVQSQAMQVLDSLNIPGLPAIFGDSPQVNALAASAPQWGLVDSSGNPVITVDSVVRMRFRHSEKVSTFPIEAGSFSSYNKVNTPYEGWFTFNRGGDLAARSDFLAQLEKIVDDVELYTFATPEISYPNVNLEEYDYERSAEKGFQLIPADLHLVQIRVAASPTFSNTADPTAQSPANNGSVQPANPTTGQLTQASAGLATAQGVGPLSIGPPPNLSGVN